MPNEPEKPIEQALHAYARKRQDDAGTPLELHPATRQLLQGEVARTLAKPAGEAPSRFQFLVAARPRLAFGGAIFATLVFVMLLMLMQSGNRIGPAGSTMELAHHAAKPAAQKEFRELSESPASAEKEARDGDGATPISAASTVSQPPPNPVVVDRLEILNGAKKDSYARAAPLSASTPPLPRTLKPAEPAVQSREEIIRQDFSFKVKAEATEAKVSGTPAAPAVAGGAGAPKNLSPESKVNRQAGEKLLVESRRQLGAVREQPAGPADKIEPPAKPQLRMMRAAEKSQPAIADAKRVAKQPAAAAAPGGSPAESGKLVKLAERDVKLGVDKSTARLAVTPVPALQTLAPVKLFAYDSAKAASNVVGFYTSGGDLRLWFSQEDARAKYRQNLNSPPVPNVLTTFQIERAGNAIRIIDADGSTYAGQIIPGNASISLAYADDESARLPDAAKKETRGKPLENNVAQRNIPALAGSTGNAPAAGFSFQATGTNLTLNQSVEFFGTIVLDAAVTQANNTGGLAPAKAKTVAPTRSEAPATKRFTTPAPASDPQTNVVLKQAEIPRGRIQGRAVVGGKNQFEIIAVPVAK